MTRGRTESEGGERICDFSKGASPEREKRRNPEVLPAEGGAFEEEGKGVLK